MNSFKNLLDFIDMEASGECWNNVTYRAYDLDRKNSGAIARRRVLRRFNVDSLPELQDDLAGLGYPNVPLSQIMRWYLFERLATGRITRHPLRREGISQMPPS